MRDNSYKRHEVSPYTCLKLQIHLGIELPLKSMTLILTFKTLNANGTHSITTG